MFVGRAFQRSGQESLEQTAAGIILSTLQLGDDDVLFRFEFGGVQRGIEGHVADHIHAELPVTIGHIRNVDGVVVAGGCVEIASGRFDFLTDRALGAGRRSFEDHVLKHVADAGLPGFFVGGTRPYVEPGGDEGEAGIPQDEDGESVGQADYLLLLAGKRFGGGIARFDSRGGLRGRSRRTQKDGHESSCQEIFQRMHGGSLVRFRISRRCKGTEGRKTKVCIFLQ